MFLFLVFIMNSSFLFTKADTCGTNDSFACKFINFSSTRQKIVVTILHNFTQAAKIAHFIGSICTWEKLVLRVRA